MAIATARSASPATPALVAIILTVAGVGGGAACSGDSAASGTVLVAPTVPTARTFGSITYEISSFRLETLAFGSIDVSASNVVPPFAVRIPAGFRHQLVAAATALDGTRCRGESAPFDLRFAWELRVDVAITCPGPRPAPGRPALPQHTNRNDGTACPMLSSWRTSPLQTSALVGPLDVAASATDFDIGRLLTFAWNTTGGAFANDDTAATTYTCGRAGAQTLLVTVSDNHPRAPCTAAVTIPVRCQ